MPTTSAQNLDHWSRLQCRRSIHLPGLLAGIEGTVMLQVLVGVDGHPAEVSVQQSSGHREFDQAARRQVLRYWRFRPAMQAGRAVQAIGIVPMEFKLDR